MDLPFGLVDLKSALTSIALAQPRIGGLLWVLPVIAMANLPNLVRGVLMIGLSAPMLPVTFELVKHQSFMPLELGLIVLKEFAIGGLIGFSLGLFVWVFTHLGELMDIESGYSNLYMFNNIVGENAGPFATAAGQAAVALFIGLGGLQLSLDMIYGSYAIWPLTDLLPDSRMLLDAFSIRFGETLWSLTVKIAAPAIIVLLLVEAAMGLVGRSARGVDLSATTFAIKALMALVVLALLLRFSTPMVEELLRAALTQLKALTLSQPLGAGP